MSKLIRLPHAAFVLLLAAPIWGFAQEQPNPKTLLPDSVLSVLQDEVSGSLALSYVIELAGYNRNRPASEYAGTYWESQYVDSMATSFGLANVHIERFKRRPQWDAEYGELWMVEPKKRLIISHRDVAAALAPGSQSVDTTAELIYCGRGEREEDYEGRDVAGKIVLVSGSLSKAHRIAVGKKNAVGVVSFNDPTGKPIDRPDQISWQSIRPAPGQEHAFGFTLSHRLGMKLLDRLERGQKVVVRARVKTAMYDVDREVPTAVIPGDGSTSQEVVLSGHLFEGISKQGAADDASGAAVVLEVGRALTHLIRSGVLPRPKRTIRLLWVPEITGTAAYLERYPQEVANMVAAISIDMIGENQTLHRNSLHLYRNPYSMASFVDDVCQDFFEYVGDTNREKVHNRRIVYGFMNPIIDPNGSQDPFFFHIEKYYGSSDHAVYNHYDVGVPAVLFNNWPDRAYHTSEDRPASLDPTQLKRGAFIAAAAAYYLASAGSEEVERLAGLMAGYAKERIGRDLTAAMEAVSRSTPETIAQSYKEAQVKVRQAYLRESRALGTVKVLAAGDRSAAQKIDGLQRRLALGQTADLKLLEAHYRNVCRQLGVPAEKPRLTAEERRASRYFPVRAAPDSGASLISRLFRRGRSRRLRPFAAREALALADGSHSVLQIRDFISAEFEPVAVDQVVRFFADLAKQGQISFKGERPPVDE